MRDDADGDDDDGDDGFIIIFIFLYIRSCLFILICALYTLSMSGALSSFLHTIFDRLNILLSRIEDASRGLMTIKL